MKLFGATAKYGNEVAVTFSYGDRFFFQGALPDEQRLLYFDLDGLKTQNGNDIRQWLAKKNKTSADRKNIARFGDELWRYADPFDMLKVDNYQSYAYSLANYFSIEELEPFISDVSPEIAKKFALVAAEADPDARVKLIDKEVDYLRRVSYPVYYTPYTLDGVKNEILISKERAVLELMKLEFESEPFGLSRVLAFAKTLKTGVVRCEVNRFALEVIFGELGEPPPPAEFLSKLRQIASITTQKDASRWDSIFWSRVTPYLELPATRKGQEIDITNAREVTVPAGWEAIESSRVGTIVCGRTALAMQNPKKPSQMIYVRGERKLKMKVMSAGGRLDYGDCTLIVEEDGMGALLVTVEQIDTLCSLNPKSALKFVEKTLPDAHPIFDALERAEDDYRQARVLADLIIEETVGIDADIARGLARSQARANRR